MSALLAVLRRELAAYLVTPVAYVFIVIFLALAGAFTFYLGDFYRRGQADLTPFFSYLPWLFLVLVPAVAMRLWAEERRSGTLELLLTLPIGRGAAMLGKFLAAWVFIALALALTFPLWLTVNYLGHPDNGAILAAYCGGLLLAGALLAIGTGLSAATRSQVVAFILTELVGLGYLLAGHRLVLGLVQGWLPPGVADALAGFSFTDHYEAIARGVLNADDITFFVLTIACWLGAGVLLLELTETG